MDPVATQPEAAVPPTPRFYNLGATNLAFAFLYTGGAILGGLWTVSCMRQGLHSSAIAYNCIANPDLVVQQLAMKELTKVKPDIATEVATAVNA